MLESSTTRSLMLIAPTHALWRLMPLKAFWLMMNGVDLYFLVTLVILSVLLSVWIMYCFLFQSHCWQSFYFRPCQFVHHKVSKALSLTSPTKSTHEVEKNQIVESECSQSLKMSIEPISSVEVSSCESLNTSVIITQPKLLCIESRNEINSKEMSQNSSRRISSTNTLITPFNIEEFQSVDYVVSEATGSASSQTFKERLI